MEEIIVTTKEMEIKEIEESISMLREMFEKAWLITNTTQTPPDSLERMVCTYSSRIEQTLGYLNDKYVNFDK